MMKMCHSTIYIGIYTYVYIGREILRKNVEFSFVSLSLKSNIFVCYSSVQFCTVLHSGLKKKTKQPRRGSSAPGGGPNDPAFVCHLLRSAHLFSYCFVWSFGRDSICFCMGASSDMCTRAAQMEQ